MLVLDNICQIEVWGELISFHFTQPSTALCVTLPGDVGTVYVTVIPHLQDDSL